MIVNPVTIIVTKNFYINKQQRDKISKIKTKRANNNTQKLMQNLTVKLATRLTSSYIA